MQGTEGVSSFDPPVSTPSLLAKVFEAWSVNLRGFTRLRKIISEALHPGVITLQRYFPVSRSVTFFIRSEKFTLGVKSSS